MELQKSFYVHQGAVWNGLQHYRLQGGLLLWLAGLMAGLYWLGRGRQKADADRDSARKVWSMRLVAVLLLVIVFIHEVARCENFSYLAFGAPLAILLIATTGRHQNQGDQNGPNTSLKLKHWQAKCSLGVLVVLVFLHGIILPFRCLQFAKADFPNFAARYREVFQQLPSNRTLLIPHDFWAAAVEYPNRDIRWFTYPIASTEQTRKNYEQQIYPNLAAGSILILPAATEGIDDRFGVYPTFPINPPDPRVWQLLSSYEERFPGSTAWSFGYQVYEKKS